MIFLKISNLRISGKFTDNGLLFLILIIVLPIEIYLEIAFFMNSSSVNNS